MKINSVLKYATALATLAVVGYSACFASIPAVQGLAANVTNGGTGTDCPGPYTAIVTMTNSTGSIWITAPAGTTNAVLSDASPYPAPYASVVATMCKNNGMTWCGPDSISFPAVGGNNYQMKLFVVSGTVTNGQPLTLQITWQ